MFDAAVCPALIESVTVEDSATAVGKVRKEDTESVAVEDSDTDVGKVRKDDTESVAVDDS
jgi:hypothetical protein